MHDSNYYFKGPSLDSRLKLGSAKTSTGPVGLRA